MSGQTEAERIRRVESLFHAALQRPPADRDAYLRVLCNNDPAIHHEVASLLAHASPDEEPRDWVAAAALQLIAEHSALQPGQVLGPYEILAFIASGGMGSVYRAHDPRTGRDVAIKVSTGQFSDRFAREVRAAAALNHPHIATLYDVGPNYLVLEFVEGETLAERITRRGSLPLDEALAVARQIAEALDAAHEKGIVHRDLTPWNIKVRADGFVKVLDFGLAKIAEDAGAIGRGSDAMAPSPPRTASVAGAIVGSAAYMAPEQARGEAVDKRADIWAFGAVLFEMLSGTPLFAGEVATDVVAAVIAREPDLSALRVRVPAAVRELLQLCLQRDTRQRLRDIGDARILIERCSARAMEQSRGDRPRGAVVWSRRARVAAVAGLLATIAAVAGVTYVGRPADMSLTALSLLPPEGATYFAGNPPAVSPDGRHIAFVAERDGRRLLFVRDLDSRTARELTGAAGAGLPFWSHDGRFIGFFADGKLKRVDASGNSPAVSLCDADQLRGGSWSKNDVIVFGTGNGGLFQVSAGGGTCSEATRLDQSQQELRHGFPWVLPDGRHFLYTAISSDPSKTAIYVGDLETGSRTKVVSSISNSAYIEPGHLLHVQNGTLVAQSFDAATHTVEGDVVPIAEDVEFAPGRGQPRYQFAASAGLLTYTGGGSQQIRQLTLFDRSGRPVGTVGAPARLGYGIFSPNGHRVLFERGAPQGGAYASDIWMHDLLRGVEARLTEADGLLHGSPVWSPDERFIAYGAGQPGAFRLMRRATAGVAQPEALGSFAANPVDWSSDGYIVSNRVGPQTGNDIWYVTLTGDRTPRRYLETRFNESVGRLSPNGKWLAYFSDHSSRSEVYVDSFPRPSNPYLVSVAGGDRPVWSRQGDELFFISADRKMMAATVRPVPGGLDIGVPRALFDVPIAMGVITSNARFDVSSDGRFLVPAIVEGADVVPMTVVQNWTTLLRK